jgi:hypothetical protein
VREDFWVFDPGNLMAHGCSKGKTLTTETMRDRTFGVLTQEIYMAQGCNKAKKL